MKYTKLVVSSLSLLFLLGCGDSATTSSDSIDSKYNVSYDNLLFYSKDMQKSSYTLTPLSDNEFNELDELKQLRVANKLLSTLFFGYDYLTMKTKIENGDFLSSTYDALSLNINDKNEIERYIDNREYFVYDVPNEEVIHILTRLFALKNLDSYYFNNFVAYTLTQTIMFSPAYELESSHSPNVASTYNRIVQLLEDEATFSYLTYMHTTSEDNWRRFRSPEDNGREMLEIFTLDTNDSKVPLSAKALQNWRLDRDNDTLVVGLNQNEDPIELFGTTIYDGDDFYTEMVKSQQFRYTITKRLVEFFFADNSVDEIEDVVSDILKSNPKTWQDIFKQIIFSKKYLFDAHRTKTAEENFFAFAKKTDFQHKRNTIYDFEGRLRLMNQASMRYKLGKTVQVPLDTLSFITYFKYFRDAMLLRNTNLDYVDDYTSWGRQGWSDSLIDSDNFNYDLNDEEKSLESFINYIFKFIISREATQDEMDMFKSHMLEDDEGIMVLQAPFNMFSDREYRDINKRHIAKVVLDYISRLDDFYIYQKVTK